jgi:hypothetical protein
MKRKFYIGQKFGYRIIKEVWIDSHGHILLFTDGTYEIIKKGA